MMGESLVEMPMTVYFVSYVLLGFVGKNEFLPLKFVAGEVESMVHVPLRRFIVVISEH